MDCGEVYVKMCEQAKEIQKLWKHSKRSGGDWYFHKELNCAYPVTPNDQNDKDCIWLPRQDQLQILSKLTWQHFDRECLKFIEPTKEQAGIKIVMRQFNKEWKDNKWLGTVNNG